MHPLKTIYKFNQEAGLLDKGYDDERECAYPIEEALEGFVLTELAYQLGEDTDATAKEVSRGIINLTINKDKLTDVDRLDKHLDAIVFAFGSIYKLGLTPQQAIKALGIVMEANMSKLSVGTDSEGKQMKPKDFLSPEPKLQKILDER